MYHAQRLDENPLIHPGLAADIGANINGPSLIRVPDWVAAPLGRYYLYFAHHQGTFIRMAYADDVRGPWTVYPGGVLHLDETACHNHIASPDVHVASHDQKIVMYFHGVTDQGQRSFRATSMDGLHFVAETDILGPFYFRVFTHGGAWYAIAKTTDAPGGGVLLRSSDGITPFVRGPDILPRQRHVAVRKTGAVLEIFYSRGEDCPERILYTTMALDGEWTAWQPSDPVDLMAPEHVYEGAELPLRASRFGAIHEPARELRDPALFEEDGRLFLLYTGAGESNICAAELLPVPRPG